MSAATTATPSSSSSLSTPPPADAPSELRPHVRPLAPSPRTSTSASRHSSSSASSPAAAASGGGAVASANARASLHHGISAVNLVHAVQSNDVAVILDALRADCAAAEKAADPDPSPPLYGSPLHLVMSICSRHVVLQVFDSVFSDRSLGVDCPWVNDTNVEGETLLHMAVQADCVEAANNLFGAKDINDTLTDAKGRTPADLLRSDKGPMAQVFSRARSSMVSEISSTIVQWASARNTPSILSYLHHNKRVAGYIRLDWIDVNSIIIPPHGGTLLHYAAAEDSIELCEWALGAGVDPDIKDKKGRKAIELVLKKNSPLKDKLRIGGQGALLKLGNGPRQAPVRMTGTLKKWVNFRTGWQLRFFVIENGNFSYYRTEADYPDACRGSISTKIALAEFPDTKDKRRFDVSTANGAKFSLQAQTPSDAKKWVLAIMESKSQPPMTMDERSASHPTAFGLSDESLPIDENVPYEADSSDVELPTTDTSDIETLSYLLRVQMDVQQKVVDALSLALASSQHSNSKRKSTLAPPEGTEHDARSATLLQDVDVSNLPALMKSSVQQVNETVGKLIDLVQVREERWSQKLQKDKNRIHLLQESFSQIRQAASDVVSDGAPAATTKPDNTSSIVSVTAKAVPPFLTKVDESSQALTLGSVSNARSAEPVIEPSTVRHSNDEGIRTSESAPLDEEDDEDDIFFEAGDPESSNNVVSLLRTTSKLRSNRQASIAKRPPAYDVLEPSNEALESSNESFATCKALEIAGVGHFGEASHRSMLPLDPSKPKPTFAVWSFIKSAIGKDLSKVTLPVVFNEPISMLQRMCEDIEYAELLSLAARVGAGKSSVESKTPAKLAAMSLGLDLSLAEDLIGEDAEMLRLMLVAAYGVSNYSSTINRTGKPFNPLLGETYEIVNHEKQYRYISEQVSHHPPVSACYADSTDWTFWGEVNVKSKFWGSSLEIHPMGNCHVLLPAPGGEKDKTEHYSWKKVTTTVNNLIVGKLSIAHLGDMVVRNWRTGQECVMSFKPKQSSSWFGGGSDQSDKDELSGGEIVGTCKDRSGNVRWTISGSWGRQLVAKRAAANKVSRLPDTVPLWKRGPMAPNAAVNFHLTPFAMMLNQLSPELESRLPPTDSRLRYDQRAMEVGNWDDATKLKEVLEVIQRKRRRVLEAQFDATRVPSGPVRTTQLPFGENWWNPRWFVRALDSDTNEEHWAFTHEYWTARESGKWQDWVINVFQPVEQS